jgi:anthranilate synthase component 1
VPSGNFTPDRFEQAVEDGKEYIRSGDIIQFVPSQRFTAPFTKSPLDLYRALRTVNPSPYMFIFDAGDFAIVGASPEVHVRLTDGRVEIRPIAGTRKRGATVAEDHALEKELLADEKGAGGAPHARGSGAQRHRTRLPLRQRHGARNDGGGAYSHVMHIVSQVEG